MHVFTTRGVEERDGLDAEASRGYRELGQGGRQLNGEVDDEQEGKEYLQDEE